MKNRLHFVFRFAASAAAVALAWGIASAVCGEEFVKYIDKRAGSIPNTAAEAQRLEAFRQEQLQQLRNEGRATRKNCQAVDEAYLAHAQSLEPQRTKGIKQLEEASGVRDLGQGPHGTDPARGRGIAGDIDSRSLSPSEYTKVVRAAQNQGLTVTTQGDAATIQEINGTYHRSSSLSSPPGSTARDLETAQGYGKETSISKSQPRPGDSYTEVMDNTKKGLGATAKPPDEITHADLQEVGKMTQRNMEAGGIPRSDGVGKDLYNQATMVKNGFSPEAAGIVRDNATPTQRAEDIARFLQQGRDVTLQAAQTTKGAAAAQEASLQSQLDTAKANYQQAVQSGDPKAIQQARSELQTTKQELLTQQGRQTAAVEGVVRNQPEGSSFMSEVNGVKLDKVTNPDGSTTYRNPQTGETLSPSQVRENAVSGTRDKLNETAAGGEKPPAIEPNQIPPGGPETPPVEKPPTKPGIEKPPVTEPSEIPPAEKPPTKPTPTPEKPPTVEPGKVPPGGPEVPTVQKPPAAGPGTEPTAGKPPSAPVEKPPTPGAVTPGERPALPAEPGGVPPGGKPTTVPDAAPVEPPATGGAKPPAAGEPPGPVPGTRAKFVRGAGIAVLAYGAYDGFSQGYTQARQEEKPGDSALQTGGKTVIYGVANTLGIPQAWQVGQQAGNEALDDYRRRVQRGEIPESTVREVGSRLWGAVVGVGRFVKGVVYDPARDLVTETVNYGKSKVQEYQSNNTAEEIDSRLQGYRNQRAAQQAAAGGAAGQGGPGVAGQNTTALSGAALAAAAETQGGPGFAGHGINPKDLRSQEPSTTAGGTVDITGGSGGGTLGNYSDGHANQADGHANAGYASAQQQTALAGASSAGDQTLHDANNIRNQGGIAAINTRGNAATTIATGDRDNSWGNTFIGALGQGLTALGNAFGGSFGTGAAVHVINNLWGGGKPGQGSGGQGGGASGTSDGSGGSGGGSGGSGGGGGPQGGSGSGAGEVRGGDQSATGAGGTNAPGGGGGGSTNAGSGSGIVTVTGSGSANASGSGSGGYAAGAQDQVIDGSAQIGNGTVKGVKVSLDYQAYTIADTFQIVYNGAVIANSGSVSGSGTISGSAAGDSKKVTIRVISSSNEGTEWKWSARVDYSVDGGGSMSR